MRYLNGTNVKGDIYQNEGEYVNHNGSMENNMSTIMGQWERICQPKWDQWESIYQPKWDQWERIYQLKWDQWERIYQPKWDQWERIYQIKIVNRSNRKCEFQWLPDGNSITLLKHETLLL